MNIAIAAVFSTVLAAQTGGMTTDQQKQQKEQKEKSAQGNGDMSKHMMKPTAADARKAVENWSADAKTAADTLLTKYGAPSGVTQDELIWRNAGDFKKIVVTKEAVQHNFPTPHQEMVMAVVDYKVPADKVDDLSMFNGSISADKTAGELHVRAKDEPSAIMLINLADDVITGKKTAQDARQQFADNARMLEQGQQPQLAQKFQFSKKRNTADPDTQARSMGK